MARLTDLPILITGAAQGLGEATARRLLSEGARVAIGDVNEAGQQVADEFGDRAIFVRLDVTDESSWQAAIAATVDAFGGLNGLVNNAGILWMGHITEMPVANIEQVLDVNLKGQILGIKNATAALTESGGGSIVNIASVDGLKGTNSTVAYSASKWGVRGLTKAAAMELGPRGIRVNAVCPGTGNPHMAAPFYSQIDIERYIEKSPVPVLFDGDNERQVTMGEIAAMVAFLMSDDSATCTGGDFVVDAGLTVGARYPGLPGS